MKKNSEMFFYAVSVVFLVVTVLMTINTYQTLARSAADYGATLGDEWFAVMTAIISSSFGFLGFSFMFYGIGMILGKIENQTEPKSTNQIKKRNK